MKPRVRHYSKFGDNHHASIEAQIEVLTERLDEDTIYDKQSDGDWNENTVGCALEARRWLDGEEDSPPSEGWKGLVQ